MKFKQGEDVMVGGKKTQIEYVHGDGTYTCRVPFTNDWGVYKEGEIKPLPKEKLETPPKKDKVEK